MQAPDEEVRGSIPDNTNFLKDFFETNFVWVFWVMAQREFHCSSTYSPGNGEHERRLYDTIPVPCTFGLSWATIGE